MFRTIIIVLGGLVLILMIAISVALAWPMANPDTEPFMEILPPPSHPEAQPHTEYRARDGTALPLRVYEADDSDTALVLLHGGGGDGAFLYRLGSYLAEGSAATVYVPDLRGHGDSPEPRGDTAYPDQLVDDVADLVTHVRQEGDWERVVLGGHSMGGGIALRTAESGFADHFDGYLLIAPFLGPDAPTAAEDGGGYLYPNVPRIIALSVLNGLGISAFDSLDVVHLNHHAELRDGLTTRRLTWRLTQGGVPEDYTAALSAIDVPLLVVVGEEDEIFNVEHFAPIIGAHAPHAEVIIKPGLNHVTGVLNEPAALDIYATWLKEL